MGIASHGYEEPDIPGSSLPAFVERAQQDVQWQAALASLGYRRVKAAFAEQLRHSPRAEIFFGVDHLKQWPTMDFVRTWLKSEKKRVLERVRWTFLGTMFATILAVLTFAFGLSVMQ